MHSLIKWSSNIENVTRGKISVGSRSFSRPTAVLLKEIFFTDFFSVEYHFLYECSIIKWEHVPLSRKILLAVLWATSSQQFSLPRPRYNVYLLKPLSWSRGNDSLKAVNLVRMEEAVKSSTRMRSLPPLSGVWVCFKHCHTEGLASWISSPNFISVRRQGLNETGFKRQTLCQWRGNDNL